MNSLRRLRLKACVRSLANQSEGVVFCLSEVSNQNQRTSEFAMVANSYKFFLFSL